MKKLLFSLLPRPRDLAVSPRTCASLRHKCVEASTVLAGILFVLFSCPMAFAQELSSLGKLGTERVDSVKKMVVDTAKLRLLYKCTYRPDTANLKREGEAWRLLQVGSHATKEWTMGAARIDSLRDASAAQGRTWMEILPLYMGALSQQAGDNQMILADMRSGVLTEQNNIVVDEYLYEEPIPTQRWESLPGDTTLLDYPCRRAKTHFRGRDFIAWYTDELPFSVGPWKFSGLPGLILCVYDTQRHYVYEAVGLEYAKAGELIYLSPRSSEQRVSRLDYLKAKAAYARDPATYMRQIPGVIYSKETLRRMKPRSYNPLERE